MMALHDKNSLCTPEAVGKYFDKEQFIDLFREIMQRISILNYKVYILTFQGSSLLE